MKKFGNQKSNNFFVGQRRSARSESSRCSQSSKISIDYVNNILDRLGAKQTRDSTAKAYLCVWRQLNKFIISLDTKGKLLSWEERTALFGAYLVHKGCQSSTLKSYFSAIKHVLRQDGYPWDDNKALLSSLAKNCKLENDRVKIRLPIQKGLFEMLLFEIQRYYSVQPFLETMYKAVFALAYYGMLRAGILELGDHTLKASNIHVSDHKNRVMLVLYSSKTHGKESRPQKIRIAAQPLESHSRGQNRNFCPVKLVVKYLKIRGEYYDNKEQLFIFRDNSPLKPTQFRTFLRLLLDRLSLDSSLYDVHSFRIGRTCDLYKFGYNLEQIKVWGCWRSNAVYRYLNKEASWFHAELFF